MVGQVLGERYRVLERLAEGGMGTVYRAEHVGLRKEVALKIVNEGAGARPDHALRFMREALLTSRIEHPNIISATDYGTFDDGTAYLAMTLVTGPTLASVMKRERPMRWTRAAEIGAQICDAIAAAQAQGIVHRDLKPENLHLQPMPDGSDVVKVLDFGIAKYARDSLAPPAARNAQQATRVGVVVGTPGYMAPEQAVGMRADHRADLYAIGVILWECVVGRKLWDASDVQQLVATQLNQKPQSVRSASGDLSIPDGFDALVASLLSSRPHGRPDSAAHTRDRLRALVLAASEPSIDSTSMPPMTDEFLDVGAVAQGLALAKERRSSAGQQPRPEIAAQPAPEAGVVEVAAAPAAEPAAPPAAAAPAVAAETPAPEPDRGAPTVRMDAVSPRGTRGPRLLVEGMGARRRRTRVIVGAGLALAAVVLLVWGGTGAPPAPAVGAGPRAPRSKATPSEAPKVAKVTAAAAVPPASPATATTSTTSAPAAATSEAAVSAREHGAMPAPSPQAKAVRASLAAGKPRAPAPDGPLPIESGQELRARGKSAFASGDFAAASSAYRAATRKEPGHAGGHAGLGASLFALGDAKGAIAAYQRAIALSPGSSGFHAALGRAYLGAGDRPRAIAAYRKAVALDPNNETAFAALDRLVD